MKIVLFVENGNPTLDDITLKSVLASQGNKVTFSNGNIPWGFEEGCDKVIMSKEFGHVREWCQKVGIKCVLSKDEAEIEDAEIAEDKPVAKRTKRTTAKKTDNSESESEE